MMIPASDQASTTAEPGEQNAPGKADIDLRRLAERILELLKAEARIERERQGLHRPWGKKVRHA